MMHWMFGNYGTSCGPGMAWFMFFFWFLVILGIIMLIRALLGSGKREGREPPRESAEEILNKRYVRGEISEEEYRKMKEQLRR